VPGGFCVGDGLGDGDVGGAVDVLGVGVGVGPAGGEEAVDGDGCGDGRADADEVGAGRELGPGDAAVTTPGLVARAWGRRPGRAPVDE
jgi:hypothetical protein